MVQEVVTKSWGSRIINALWGIVIGFILVIGSFILIFWNEGNSTRVSQSLLETEKAVATVASSPLLSSNNMHVVYFNGDAVTDDILKDSLFNVSAKALKLQRKVEMYQWQENSEQHSEENTGGSEKEIITYTYKQVWSDKVNNSHDFKDPSGHENPTHMAIEPDVQYAKKVTVGDFHLPHKLVKQIEGGSSINLSKVDLAPLQVKLNRPMHHEGENTIYVGTDPEFPRIGDLKVTLLQTEPQTVSIIGQQTQDTLQPYMAPSGEPIEMLTMGLQSPQQMIHEAESENKMMTWLLRLTALLLMIIGIGLLLRPVVILADVIPFLGNIVEVGTGLIAFLTGLVLWSSATAIAWFTVRPLLSIGLMILAILIAASIFSYRKIFLKKKIA